MKVLILGSRGNLGQDLVHEFESAGHEVVATDRETLDVADRVAVRAHILAGGYQAIINSVAWNDVDGAEDQTNRALVWELNSAVPGRLARLAKEIGAKFVHYSTDYVFAGTKPEGYIEDDSPNPISVYGESKLAGEVAVRAVAGQSFICRLSKLYGRPGSSAAAKPSFVSIMLKLAADKPALNIVDEEVGRPTYTKDVARASLKLLTDNFDPGTYHLVNEGSGVTWYGFAQEFFTLLGVTTPNQPVSASAFPKPARRPAYGQLNNTKFPPLRLRLEALKSFFAEHPESVPEKFKLKLKN
ncbi:dTDP-4-dehydrorhamnose reductase [Patescibacteria group bacterium]|nr:dTDP-4-dehydrorhamnose reductase [Patescibacteria group bacterium]